MPVLTLLAAAALAPGGGLPAWAQRLLAGDFTHAQRPTHPLPGTIDLAGMTVTLERTRIADVRTRLGGHKRSAGDTGSSEVALCYDWRDGRARSRVWLSAGEMGGADQAIGTVTLERAVRPNDVCPLLRGAVGAALAVGLGASTSQIVATYGASRDHRYMTEQAMAGGSRLRTLSFALAHGQVTRMLMTQVTSF